MKILTVIIIVVLNIINTQAQIVNKKEQDQAKLNKHRRELAIMESKIFAKNMEIKNLKEDVENRDKIIKSLQDKIKLLNSQIESKKTPYELERERQLAENAKRKNKEKAKLRNLWLYRLKEGQQNLAKYKKERDNLNRQLREAKNQLKHAHYTINRDRRIKAVMIAESKIDDIKSKLMTNANNIGDAERLIKEFTEKLKF